MKKFFSLPYGQALLAAFACSGFVLLWAFPVFIMGDGFAFPPFLVARNLAETGIFSFTDSLGRVISTNLISEIGVPSAVDARLSSIVMAMLSRVIEWNDLVGWAIAGSAVFAVGMFFWWATVLKLFGSKIAWMTLIITALMPVYFREAVWFDNYNLALTCLAAAGAVFVWLKDRQLMIALVLAGLLFGASVSAKDVFLIMIPWIGITFLWKSMWKGGFVFFLAAAAVYILPYIGDISTLGYPVNHNIARLWPGAEEIANETYLHMYSDPYTYFFDREAFDERFKTEAASKPFSERMADEKVMLSYGLVDGAFRRIRLGMWLIVHDIPPFFQRQTVGGVFLWLFALPGIILLWRRERGLVLWLLGLVVSMYFVIRFVLMYEREHFMNIAWIFALFVGYGIAEIGSMQKYVKTSVATSLLILVCVLQLLQANRYEFASRYRKSNVAELRADAQVLMGLPKDAVIAVDMQPRNVESLALLSNRTLILFREETVERLKNSGALGDAFQEYGVTHTLNYTVQTPAKSIISSAVVIVPPSAMLKWLVHLIR